MAQNFTVYKMYDEQGAILYVGMTRRGFRRLREHQADKPWFAYVTRTETEHFDTKEACASREAALIREWKPPHNTLQTRKPVARKPRHVPTPAITAAMQEAAIAARARGADTVSCASVFLHEDGSQEFFAIEYVTRTEVANRQELWRRGWARLLTTPTTNDEKSAC